MLPGSAALREYLGEGPSQVQSVREKEICRTLPSEYIPFRFDGSPDEAMGLSYLIRRGVTREQIAIYRMGYAIVGDYRGHVIIPSFDASGAVNCFVARSIHGPGYMMPDTTKDVIVNEHMVDWDREIVLVEGIFDAVAVGSQGIPLLGKSLLPKLMAKLIAVQQTVHICLDSDAWSEAWALAEDLLEHGVVCSVSCVQGELVTEKDPASVGHERTWRSIRRATLIKDSGYARIARYW